MTPSHSLLCRVPPSPSLDSGAILSPSAEASATPRCRNQSTISLSVELARWEASWYHSDWLLRLIITFWRCGAWATIPKHNAAGRSARRGAPVAEPLDRGRDFRARAAARPAHRLRHGLPHAAPAGGTRVDPGADVRGSGKPVRRACRTARPRALPGVRSAPRRRRPGRPDGAATSRRSRAGSTSTVTTPSSPALPRLQERGEPGQRRSRSGHGSE